MFLINSTRVPNNIWTKQCVRCGINTSCLPPEMVTADANGSPLCRFCSGKILRGEPLVHVNGSEKELNTLGSHWVTRDEFDRRWSYPWTTAVLLFSNFGKTEKESDETLIELGCRFDAQRGELYYFLSNYYYSGWWGDFVTGARDLSPKEFAALCRMNGIDYFDGLNRFNTWDYFCLSPRSEKNRRR